MVKFRLVKIEKVQMSHFHIANLWKAQATCIYKSENHLSTQANNEVQGHQIFVTEVKDFSMYGIVIVFLFFLNLKQLLLSNSLWSKAIENNMPACLFWWDYDKDKKQNTTLLPMNFPFHCFYNNQSKQGV